MRRLLTQLQAEIDAEDSARSVNLRIILHEIERVRLDPPDLGHPLAYRAAIKAAGDLLVRLYGDQALQRAREIERRMPRTFARVVTKRLECLKREAARIAGGEPT